MEIAQTLPSEYHYPQSGGLKIVDRIHRDPAKRLRGLTIDPNQYIDLSSRRLITAVTNRLDTEPADERPDTWGTAQQVMSELQQ